MTAEKILQSDVLDILFEGRNKLYGAYELRRTYPRRVKQSIGGMVLAIALLAGGYYLNFGKQNTLVASLDVNDTVTITMIDDPKIPPKPIPPPPPQAALPVASTAFTAPLIVEDLPEIKMPDQNTLDTSAISLATTSGVATTGTANPVNVEGSPGGQSNTPAPPLNQPAIPTGPVDMGIVDQKPEYPGGNKALINYMVRNLTSELEPGVKYIVKAQFVINEEGAVSDAVILYSDDETLNIQVIKAIRKMTRWKPGVLNGQKVAVRFTMPVTFVGPEE